MEITSNDKRSIKLTEGKLKCRDCGKTLLDANDYKPEDITGELVEYKIFNHRQECIATV